MSGGAIYERVMKPAMFQLSAEQAHDLAIRGIRFAGDVMPWAIRGVFGPTPKLPVEVCGIAFRNPVGLAAGMDKNALALAGWDALGFGFVEIGTVTAHAQPGNPKPRLFRYPDHEALINRMGFNNDGSAAVADRLAGQRDAGRWPKIPVGINIGKSKISELADAPKDYRLSFERLREFGDYFVVNVSSPNTPNLRDLQTEDSLGAILSELRDVDSAKPIFVKVAPDLTAGQREALAGFLASAHLTGLVVSNTTLDHSVLGGRDDEAGGLSGAPLCGRAQESLEAFVNATPLPIIASGGIMNGADAAARIASGAKLVQIYTGFVYHGPELIREICRSIGTLTT